MQEVEHLIEFSHARDIMKCCLCKERQILAELLKQEASQSEPQINVADQGGVGRVSKQNDRGHYFWIDAVCKNKTYRLALFYNEVDTASGNFHTQIGRIQFLKDVEKRGQSGKTANMKCGAKKWFLNTESQWMPLVEHPAYIWNQSYCRKQVIDDFINFIKTDLPDLEGEKIK